MKINFENIWKNVNGIRFITGKDSLRLIESDDAVLVDLREGIFKNGRSFDVKHLIQIPYSGFKELISELPEDRFIIFADYVGLKSKAATEYMNSKGILNTASLIGGIAEWENDGLPMIRNIDEELVGGCACKLRPRKINKAAGLKKILFVCIHNSARSQMAEAFLNSMGIENVYAESAGVEKGSLNPLVVEVMKEIGIDISGNRSKTVSEMIEAGKTYDYVITVCDQASGERCPVFPGQAYKRLHFEFEDPSKVEGTQEEKLSKIRVIRDQIRSSVEKLASEL